MGREGGSVAQDIVQFLGVERGDVKVKNGDFRPEINSPGLSIGGKGNVYMIQ